MAAVTRLGVTATPQVPYGSFAGKVPIVDEFGTVGWILRDGIALLIHRRDGIASTTIDRDGIAITILTRDGVLP